jgi:acetyl-CoA carboxylase biotin carboxyl carrier protein
MQIREIISLMNHMKQADISKLEFESGGDVLRLERSMALPADWTGSGHAVDEKEVGVPAGCSGTTAIQGSMAGQSGSPASARPAAQTGAESAFNFAAAANEAPEPEDNAAGWLVRSPVVGIYYASPSPDRDPFVQVGSIVEIGSTLCIIEAMKLMNEVNCNAEGKVLEIYAVNGQRVEYNQPLMRIGG